MKHICRTCNAPFKGRPSRAFCSRECLWKDSSIRLKGVKPPRAEKQLGLQFLREHVGFQGDQCLSWPFSRSHGYGRVSIGGRRQDGAHRIMCELAHGPAPSPQHQAAHSCGKGHEGCVNPRHLSWKTLTENKEDCKIHGTQPRNRYGHKGALTIEQVRQILALKGLTNRKLLGVQYGVSEHTIKDIWAGRSYAKKLAASAAPTQSHQMPG